MKSDKGRGNGNTVSQSYRFNARGETVRESDLIVAKGPRCLDQTAVGAIRGQMARLVEEPDALPFFTNQTQIFGRED